MEIFENSSIKAIELINNANVSNLGDLASQEVYIREDAMKRFLLYSFINSSNILNSVLSIITQSPSSGMAVTT